MRSYSIVGPVGRVGLAGGDGPGRKGRGLGLLGWHGVVHVALGGGGVVCLFVSVCAWAKEEKESRLGDCGQSLDRSHCSRTIVDWIPSLERE